MSFLPCTRHAFALKVFFPLLETSGSRHDQKTTRCLAAAMAEWVEAYDSWWSRRRGPRDAPSPVARNESHSSGVAGDLSVHIA